MATSMPVWEIACLTLTALAITAVAIYMFFRCWRSIKALNKDAENRSENPRPKRSWKSAWPRPDLDITQVYGVPYRSPTPTIPQPLDPAKLDELVMEGKSDLHPKYLEFKDGLGDVSVNSMNETMDHRVTWNGESVLMESEFHPSITESPIIEVHRGSSIVMNESPKVKKVLRISYNRDVDGAPEITNITTDVASPEHIDDIENGITNADVIKNSTPKSARSVNFAQIEEDSQDGHVAQLDHVTLPSSNERTLLKAPGGRWVSFDEDNPTVLVQDENGLIRHKYEFDN